MTGPVALRLAAGEADIGRVTVAVAAAGAGGALRVGGPGGSVVRPLSFGERGQVVLRALTTPDPVAEVAAGVRAAAVGGDPVGGQLGLAVDVLALHLAGAGSGAPGFASATVLLARSLGWSPAEVALADAAEVDQLARMVAGGVPDPGWQRVVFAAGAGNGDPDRLRRELAQDLVRRGEEPVDPAALRSPVAARASGVPAGGGGPDGGGPDGGGPGGGAGSGGRRGGTERGGRGGASSGRAGWGGGADRERDGSGPEGSGPEGSRGPGGDRRGGEGASGEPGGSEGAGGDRRGGEGASGEPGGSEGAGGHRRGGEGAGGHWRGGEGAGGHRRGGEGAGGHRRGGEGASGEGASGEGASVDRGGVRAWGGARDWRGQRVGGERVGGERVGGERVGGERVGGGADRGRVRPWDGADRGGTEGGVAAVTGTAGGRPGVTGDPWRAPRSVPGPVRAPTQPGDRLEFGRSDPAVIAEPLAGALADAIAAELDQAADLRGLAP